MGATILRPSSWGPVTQHQSGLTNQLRVRESCVPFSTPSNVLGSFLSPSGSMKASVPSSCGDDRARLHMPKVDQVLLPRRTQVAHPEAWSELRAIGEQVDRTALHARQASGGTSRLPHPMDPSLRGSKTLKHALYDDAELPVHHRPRRHVGVVYGWPRSNPAEALQVRTMAQLVGPRGPHPRRDGRAAVLEEARRRSRTGSKAIVIACGAAGAYADDQRSSLATG